MGAAHNGPRWPGAVLAAALLFFQPSTLNAQPSANRVLDLDGMDDYVRLPAAGFTNLHQATIEAWVKWRVLDSDRHVFEFGGRPREMYVGTSRDEMTPNSAGMKFLVVDDAGNRRRVDVYGGFRVNEWTHLAVVTGPGGVRLYLNGMLVAKNDFAGSLSSLGGADYCLGRGNYIPGQTHVLDGQLDEVRVWSVMRTEEEIRANLFRRLAGREPGLAGLWNFDDATQPGRDASTNGFHGQLFGDARSVPAELPPPAALAQPGLVEGRVTDPEGAPVTGAQIAIAPPGFFKDRANTAPPVWASFGLTDNDGRYRLVVFTPPESTALGSYTRDEELYGLRTNLALQPGQRQDVDLNLQGNVVVAGTVVAMDNTPLAGVQLGLAKPRSSPGEEPQFVGSPAYTRDNGEFRFYGTRPAGRYELLALTQRGPVSLLEGQMINFNPQQPLTNLAFHLAPMKKGRWRSFGVTEGLPNNRVYCLSLEADGTIWVGTASGGLARFDGEEFIPWDAPVSLRDASVYGLGRDPQGVLWACTSRGMARFDGREWTLRYSSKDGLPDDSSLATAWDTAGRMWVGSGSGLFRLEGERFVQVLSADGRSLGRIDDLLAETNGPSPRRSGFGHAGGTMWIASSDRGPFRWDGKELRPLPAANGLNVGQSGKVYRDGQGQIWFSTRAAVLRWDAASTNLVDAGIGEAGSAIHRDPQGAWWVSDSRGLQRRAAGSTVVYRKADGLASDVVRAIVSDDRGALWVGTDDGLSRFEEEGLQVLSTKDGLPRNIVTRVVVAPDGSVWFTCPRSDSTSSSVGDFLCRYDGRSVTRYGRERGLGAILVGGLHVDADGTVWVGAGGNNGRGDWISTQITGVWRSDGNQFTQLDASAGLSDVRVGAIERAADGRLWVVCEFLAKRFDGLSSQVVSIPDFARTVLSSTNGDVWVGTDVGAFRWNERFLSAWTSTNGLDGRVLAIAVATNGVTWFGTAKGLFRSENAGSPPVPMLKRGLLSGNVWSLLLDRDGLLWIGTDNGVARFDGTAWSLLGESDGLPGKVVYGIQQAADGAMWFGTDGGLVRYRRKKTTPAPPAVTVRTDRASGILAQSPSLVQGRWASFRFHAVDASTPAARRQYRFEIKGDGQEAPSAMSLQTEPRFEWNPPKPGTYTVAVRYFDGELNSSKPALATVTVVPPWYLNARIMVPAVAGNFGLLVWAFIARALYLRKRHEAQRLREQMFEQEHEAKVALETKKAALEAEMRRRQQAEQSLSLVEEQQAERFHTSGTLRADAPSYVERRADRELLAALSRGDFCYVLTSRQMGKSSLMVRASKRLRKQGCCVATLDLTAIGTNLTPDQWYLGLLSRIGTQLDLEDEAEAFWNAHGQLGPCQRFFRAIREAVLQFGVPALAGQAPDETATPRSEAALPAKAGTPNKALVIFVDELDVVRSLPFRTDEFFAAIREQLNRRSEDSALNQLTFCLLGVATPSELIQDTRMTPFNIGQRIELEDFSREEVAPLTHGLGRSPEVAGELMDRIHYWTAGHPYLTQKLCKAVVLESSVQTPAALDDLCCGLFFTPKAVDADDNLIFVRERLLRSDVPLAELLALYGRVRSGDRVEASDSNPLVAALRLAGIIRQTDGTLRVRNRIYEQVFIQDWMNRAGPAAAQAPASSPTKAEVRRQNEE